MTEKYTKVFEQAKKEFFGIDKQIELMLKSIETWEYSRKYMARPFIFNVVGMTGVGKTAVINRILELLDLNNNKVYFKFNNKTTDVVESLRVNNMPDSIFIFDEFQYLRTKNENGEEIRERDDKGFNIVWDLLDNGEIVLQKDDYSYFGLGRMLLLFDEFMRYDIKYKEGVFSGDALPFLIRKYQIDTKPPHKIEEEKAYIKNIIENNIEIPNVPEVNEFESLYDPSGRYFENDITDENVNLLKNIEVKEVTLKSFLPTSIKTIRDSIKNLSEKHNYPTNFDLEYKLYKMQNIEELFAFFDQFKDSKPLPIVKKFNNSLVITISNIDEAYKVAREIDSDLDADIFYRETSKISMLTIRKALLERFRPEQVARLGGNYILYPSLNKSAFKSIIEKELNNFKDTVTKIFDGVDNKAKVNDVIFSDEVKKIIYLEGVFPVVGARSLFSTVNEIVSEKLPKIIQTIELKQISDEIKILFDYNKKKSEVVLTYERVTDSLILEKETIKYDLKVENLRREKKEDIGKQAHRAVHESGHAVCSVILNNIVPEVVYSTVINSSGAFNMFSEDDYYYHRKNTYINEIAVSIGGYVAESIIFGEENVSNGSSSDISKLTNLLMNLYKNCGFGGEDMIGAMVSQQMPYSTFSDRNYSIVDYNKVDERVKEDIQRAISIAKETIGDQKVLLLKMVEHLIKNPKLTKKQIINMVKKYAVGYDTNNMNKNKTNFYIDIVNEKIKNINKV